MQKEAVEVSQKDEKLDNDETPTDVQLNETADANDSAMVQSDLEKNKPHRRYWTPKEEERFFEIWGRENWRLKRHGKNTIHFSHWSEEMRQRFNIDIKPEEVQAKVNQTRSKYRQVKKQIEMDNSSAVRWKKYDLIEKILRNEYRPKDAEPVPAHALENNRDVSPSELNAARQHTPTNVPTNSPNGGTQPQQPQQHPKPYMPSDVVSNEQQINVEPNTASVNLPNVGEFGTSNNCGEVDSASAYNSELFAEDIQIKKEESNDYNEFIDEQPMQEQTPQQYLAQQQQEIYKQQTNSVNQSEMKTITESNVRNAQALQKQSQQLQDQINNQIQMLQQNNQNHTGNTNNTNTDNNNININNNNNNNSPCTNQITNSNNRIITPRATSTPTTTTTSARKRRAQPMYNNHTLTPAATSTPASTHLNAAHVDSLEFMYMEEVRKKNRILEEQKEIARKRMQLEERKLALMEQFFPKCLALQEQILQKLNNT